MLTQLQIFWIHWNTIAWQKLYSRWWAIVKKELIQLKRDRVTLALIVVVPIIQIVLFGFAINTDPKHLPTAIVSGDHGVFSRSLIVAMENSRYFDVKQTNLTVSEGEVALKSGKTLFLLNIPADFTRKVLRGERPEVLLEADATDPSAIGGATAAMTDMLDQVFGEDFRGSLRYLVHHEAPYTVNIHLLYNPEKITQYNIIPGLIGSILTFTLTMMTAIAITRERERGTMEQLLAMPIKPYEVVTGKIIPYIFIGLIQATLIIVAANNLFNIPFLGSIFALYLVILLFISVTIAIGITLSSFAQSQMQSMQFTIMMLLPSLLLSGFMFPFAGMPIWAQHIGQALPLTYFVRLVRAIMLKGSTWGDLWTDIWPLCIMLTVVVSLAIKCYRKTLD